MRLTWASLRLPVAAAFATIAGAICLGPSFLTGSWFLPSAFGVIAVGAGCEAARRFAASRSTVPLGGLAALAAYLLLRYGHDQAVWGIVPWTGSIDQLGHLASNGRHDIDQYAAPVGVSPGIELITVGGVGLVGLAVDTLAVTWRRAALAGLPLLVLYTVPTAVAPDGVSWVAFTIAGIAFLTLLLTESRERVSRWGRPMRHIVARENWKPDVDASPLGQVGRRVGATALGLALVVPAVLPDVSTQSFGFGGGGFGNGGGGGDSVSVLNPILTLGDNLRQGDDTAVIRYKGAPTYLREVGLDEFTGDQWKPSTLEVSRHDNDVEDGLDKAPGLTSAVATTKRHYRIEVFDQADTWLPLPYPSTLVKDIDGTWLYDQSTFNVFGQNSSTRNITYQVTALTVHPTPQQLRTAPSPPASLRRYMRLPSSLDPSIGLQAQKVTAGMTSDYDRALKLQDWLRDPLEFTYSQTLGEGAGDGNGSQAIVQFLASRRGYCVQFASTMAVMARSLGIPARVAVGFATGSPVGKRHLVTRHDAHAWPELYFQGVGWVPFEPTPGGPAGDPPSYAQETPGGSGTAGDGQTSGTTAPPTGAQDGAQSENAGRTPIGEPIPKGDPGAGGAKVGAGPVQLPILPTVVGLVVLLLLAVPSVTRIVVRRFRWRRTGSPTEVALAAWADLHATLLDVGYHWDPADPPRRGAARLTSDQHLVGEPAQALHRVAAATERARYAPEMSAVGNLRADVEAVRAALIAGSSPWVRVRARLLPRSTRSVAHGLAERLADGLDALDSATAAVGSWLRLRPRRT